MSCGYNVILKNNPGISASMGKAKGYYITGCDGAFTSQNDLGFYSSHSRIFGNYFKDIVSLSGVSDGYCKRVIKNSSLFHKIKVGTIDENTYFDNCYIEVNYPYTISAGNYENCDIVLKVSDYTDGSKFYNCTLSTIGNKVIQTKGDTFYDNCVVNVVMQNGYGGHAYFTNCILKHSYYKNPDLIYYHFENCTFDIE